MGLFGSKKKKLLELQKLVMPNSPDHLIMSEYDLMQRTRSVAQNNIQTIQEHVKTVNTSADPDEYFKSYDLLIEKATYLSKLEPYISFSGELPSSSLQRIIDIRNLSIKDFLNRYRVAADETASSKISTKDKIAVYNDFYSRLQLYYSRMQDNEADINNFNAEIKEKIRDLETVNNTQCNIDSKMDEAVVCVIEAEQASTSLLQRRLKIGYTRAGKMLDDMERMGIVSSHKGCEPRKVLITIDEWNENKSVFMGKVSKEQVVNEASNEILEKENYYKLLNIEPQNDGYFLDNLTNFILPKSSETEQTAFINSMITTATPYRLKLVLFDFNMSYFSFKNTKHMLIPLISAEQKAISFFEWLNNEMQMRLRIYSEYDCKDLNSYNQSVGKPLNKKEMPHIVVVAQEVYYLLKNEKFKEALTPVLLNSLRTGIHICLFSKFTLNNLPLGVNQDLLDVENTRHLMSLFSDMSVVEKDFSNTENMLNDLDGHDFELYCGDLLKKNGFKDVTVTQASNDYGVDITAVKDDIKYAIQCKKYSTPVGVSAVQEVIASKSVYGCHIAAVLTNNTFTHNARVLADKNGVLLWDKEKLIKFIKEAK